MNEKFLTPAAVTTAALMGLILMGWWLLHNPTKDFIENIPGMDGRPERSSSRGEAVEIGSIFAQYDGSPSEIRAGWPRFRGADFDNIGKENTRLLDDWGSEGPAVSWSVELGEGHGGPVVSNGRVYVLDYDEEERADILRCFSLDDGKEIWRRGYNVYVKRNHGMSRTVPAVTDKYVVTIGPKCHVMCVDAGTGDFKWGLDLENDYGAEVPLWYTGQCPLIDDSTAVLRHPCQCWIGMLQYKQSNCLNKSTERSPGKQG